MTGGDELKIKHRFSNIQHQIKMAWKNNNSISIYLMQKITCHQSLILFSTCKSILCRRNKVNIMASDDLVPSSCKVNLNTLRPRNNGRHFADDIFRCILLNEHVWITIKNSLKFVPKGPINNIPALVQIMAWCRPGDKPLSEPMLVSLLTHICITRPQWVNNWQLVIIEEWSYEIQIQH